ncbi:MAG TPA: membrane protein insertase YidC [Clostridia bacterium]|nr:membrane protein insertase YidC [Clostridia bacterium]
MFGALVDFLSNCIQFFYTVTANFGLPNYGIAILLFTVAVKVLLFPLTAYQIRSMKKIQELQPKIQKIQQKYKNDPQKAQQAMLELYQKEKVNPFSGCLPLLIQMPILIALFNSLRRFFDPLQHPEYVNLDHASFFWVDNLGAPDPWILPLLVGLFTFLQSKFSMSNPNDQTQKTMLYVMPLMMAWFARSFPAGLSLYWVMYSIMSALEQAIIRRAPGGVKKEEVA